jgi:hypothetical protein
MQITCRRKQRRKQTRSPHQLQSISHRFEHIHGLGKPVDLGNQLKPGLDLIGWPKKGEEMTLRSNDETRHNLCETISVFLGKARSLVYEIAA